MPAANEPLLLPFTHGIDTRNPPHMVQAPYLLAAKDRYFDGDVGLKKRHGHKAINLQTASVTPGIPGSIVNAKSALAYKNELLIPDDRSLYTYSPVGGPVARGTLIPVAASQSPLAVNARNQQYCEYLTTDTLQAWVYIDSRNGSHVYVTVADIDTGAIISLDVLVGTNRVCPRLVRTSTGWVLLYSSALGSTYGSGCTLYGRQFLGLPSVPFGPEYVIGSNLSVPAAYDAAYSAYSERTFVLFMAADNNLGTCSLVPLHPSGRVASHAESGFQSMTSDNFANGIDMVANRVAITCSNGQIAVGAQGKSVTTSALAFYVATLNDASFGPSTWSWFSSAPTYDLSTIFPSGPFPTSSFAPALSLTLVFDAGYQSYAQALHLFASVTCTDNSVATVHIADLPSGDHIRQILPCQQMAGKPFLYDEDLYLWVTNSPQVATSQPTIFLQNLTGDGNASAPSATPVVVAAFAYGIAKLQSAVWCPIGTHTQWAQAAFPATAMLSPTEFALPTMQETRLTSEGLQGLVGLYSSFLSAIEFVTTNQLQSTRLGESHIFAGAIVNSYDGASLTEHGFLLYPELVSIAGTTGGGVAGNVQYCAIWRWVDACGQVYQSAQSAITAFTMPAGDNAVVLAFSSLQLSRKANVVLEIYRTINNGSVFQLVTDPGSPIFNDPTQATVTFTDYVPDSTLEGRQLLYTVSGELSNDPPPSASVICASKNRIFMAGGADDEVVTYSKQFVKNSGLGVSLAFQRRISILAGPITAIGAMDDYIIVFKNPGIFWWSGNGPSASGVSDDFSNTEMLTPELGCVNPHSIVNTSDGIYFQSQKGIYLLTRGLNLVPVGMGAQGYNAQTVVSAVMMPSTQQIRFGCVEDEALIYHYRIMRQFADITAGQWTTFTNHAQLGACLWQGAYTYARADGTVWVETDGYSDPDGPFFSVVKTAHIKAGHPLQAGQFRQIALLGEYQGPHNLQIDFAYDYRTASHASIIFDAESGCEQSLWGDDANWGDSPTWGNDYDDVYAPAGPIPIQVTALGVVQLTITDRAVADAPLGNSADLEIVAFLAEPADRNLRPPQKKQVG